MFHLNSTATGLPLSGFNCPADGDTVTAEVIAVFDRCCYLKLETQPAACISASLLCIGQTSIQPGPINCLLDDRLWQSLKPQLKTGSVARISKTRLMLAGRSIELPAGFPYESPPLITLCKTTQLVILDRLELLAEYSTASSLCAQVICPVPSLHDFGDINNASLDKATRIYMAPLVSELRKELAVTLTKRNDRPPGSGRVFASAHQLLGAGAGLTPAGDDLLAGVLLALRFFDQTAAANRLYNELVPHLPTGTNVISMVLLMQAAAGRTSLPLVRVFTALGDAGSGDADAGFNTTELADGINAIGHSSGWDCVAGIALAAQALLQSRTSFSGTATNVVPAPTTTRLSNHA